MAGGRVLGMGFVTLNRLWPSLYSASGSNSSCGSSGNCTGPNSSSAAGRDTRFVCPLSITGTGSFPALACA